MISLVARSGDGRYSLRMRLRAAYALLFGASAGIACTVGALDGFSGGPDLPDIGGFADVSVTDSGGTDSAEASPADAVVDGGGCPPTAVVCETFDEANPLMAWTEITNGTATLAVRNDRSTSAPMSLRASLDGDAGPQRAAYVSRTLTGGDVTHARLSYSIYIEERPVTGEAEISLLRFVAADDEYSDFYVAIDATSAHFTEQHKGVDGGYKAGAAAALGTALPATKWLRVSIELQLSGATFMAISVDGSELARKSLQLNGPGVPRVAAGITYGSNDTAQTIVWFDDVTFEVLP